MTRIRKFIFVVSLCTIGAGYVYGQGCSDAGFCTISSFKPNGTDSSITAKNKLVAGGFFGKADNSISVYGTYLEYNRQISERWGVDLKWTTLAQNGNQISTFGLSDIFVNANYKFSKRLSVTAGAKIPLSGANRRSDNLPLPMDYQASLGTVDLILGMGYEISKIQFVAAVQQPLTQNDNQFIAANYPLDSELRTFQTTNGFERSGDVLLRISYPVNVTPKLKLTPCILPIYHLANDKYRDASGVKQEIKGSHGLTLNGNAYLDYEIDGRNSLQLNAGMPFIVRDSRPDGLTRSFIANLEYRINF